MDSASPISISSLSSICSALVDQPGGTAASHDLASAKTRFSMTLVDGVRLGLALVPPLHSRARTHWRVALKP